MVGNILKTTKSLKHLRFENVLFPNGVDDQFGCLGMLGDDLAQCHSLKTLQIQATQLPCVNSLSVFLKLTNNNGFLQVFPMK